MALAKKLPNMTSNQTRMRVLDFLPTSYWVDGDTGMKQTSKQAWDNVYINAAELAVIVPIPEAVLDDAEFEMCIRDRYQTVLAAVRPERYPYSQPRRAWCIPGRTRYCCGIEQ